MSALDDMEQVVNDIQDLASKRNGDSLPTPQQLYTMGGILSRIQNRTQQEEGRDLVSAFQELMDSIPEDYLYQICTLFHRGIATLCIESKSLDDLTSAIQTLNGLFSHSHRACQIACSKNWISTLASIYDKLILKGSSRVQKDDLLSLLSFLLLDGLFLQKHQVPIEEVVMAAIQAMEEESTECLRDLQEWQKRSELSQRSLESAIKNLPINDDTIHQREYIYNMLESSRLKEPTAPTDTATAQKKLAVKDTTNKSVSAADEVERRIAQVKQIIPDFGEGFIESALSLFQGNVEVTVATLLNNPSQYPPSLQFLDPSLPRRKKARAEDEAKESAEAREVVKERMALEAQREQEKYKALLYVSAQEQQEQQANEYDDDYDDQYDEIDVKLGGADNGFYDFEQIKIFNKVAREDEAEGSFWDANRNTNRTTNNRSNNNNADNGGNNQFRGPDKIKGGRVVGPDGKIVRKQNPKKNKKQDVPQQENQQGPQSNDNNAGNGNNKEPQNQKGKPKTKPKSNNRVNRQRDKKQKSQGTFGV
jgi:hypothetical protein